MATLIASNYYRGSRGAPSRSASLSIQPPMRQRTLASYFSPQQKTKIEKSPSEATISLTEGKKQKSSFLLPTLVEKAIPSGGCIALSFDSRNLFKILQHLFFLSPWQDQSLLVLTGMEKIKFPPLVASNASCNRGANTGIFETRKQFEDYQRTLFLEMEQNYALNKLRPSYQSSAQYGNPFSSTSSQWKLSVEEVASLDIFDDSFFLRYNYNWQCHLDSSPQNTLYRVLHYCCLHLFTNCYQEELDPYRNLQPPPQPLSVQLQAIIAIHNSSQENQSKNSPAPISLSQSQPMLDLKENTENAATSNSKNLNTPTDIKKEPEEEKEEKVESAAIVSSDSKESPPSWMDRYRAEWIMARILTHGIAELEKQKDYHAVSCMYRLLLGCGRWGVNRRGQWWERLSLVLYSHLSNPGLSLSVALLAIEDPLMPPLSPERISLMKRIKRLYKPPLRWSTPPQFPSILEPPCVYFTGELLSSAVGRKNRWKSLELPVSDSGIEVLGESNSSSQPRSVSVESLALQYYQQHGWEGLHCEGSIVYPLFTMLLYPVLFADIPCVFQSKFQDAPLDLYSSDFYKSRAHLFDSALLTIKNSSSGELSASLETFWKEHEGEIIQAVDWKRFPLLLYQTVCTCFGGTLLSELFRVVAQNYRASRSGMPDLLLWKLTIDENNVQHCEVLFSEVKGPRDRLSAKQILWIHRMLQANIHVEVLYVKENTP